jgi:hypothetical protein
MKLCHLKRGSYICLPSESNGSNLLDEPLKGFIVKLVCPLGPCKPRAFGDHDLQWKCTIFVECKTSISAVLTDTNGHGNSYRIDDHYWIVLCLYFSYSLFTLHDHMFIMGLRQLVATYMLKFCQLKATCSQNSCHAFWASWTQCYIYWVRHVLTLTISTTPIRLVINQSVIPIEWSLHLKISVFSLSSI